ncbi:hypothetical protein RclHR1_01330007 [Rhizophagus clarus]|uniref:Uncharacterized protein n=1 Tax=Rhizophagus clarus TaxID=94130 RepID=A0A2Z6Q9P0_9GLOM|nr:hypothetical protein RclHR1_01330007 [Rhizophagus clarus]
MNRVRENFLKILSSVPTKASVETDQYPSSGENNSDDSTNKNQIQWDWYEIPTVSLKRFYEETCEFPDPKYFFDLKTKGLTTREKFVAWWNENHPDCQITADSIKEWTYHDDEDPSSYNVHWSEYGE